jgi:hypothetical protein
MFIWFPVLIYCAKKNLATLFGMTCLVQAGQPGQVCVGQQGGQKSGLAGTEVGERLLFSGSATYRQIIKNIRCQSYDFAAGVNIEEPVVWFENEFFFYIEQHSSLRKT